MAPRSSGVLLPLAVGGLGFALLLGLLFLYRPAPSREPVPEVWTESFQAKLDAWSVVRSGDFSESEVDIVDGRLRIRCATIGTDARTVKFLGARQDTKIQLIAGTRISFEVDWNNQQNGTYLSAGMVLAPVSVDGNPLAEKDWFKIEYVGVPPGKNARLVVATNKQTLFNEGWPEKKEGRKIGLQHVQIEVKETGFVVWENGTSVYESREKIPFQSAHVYLILSSHSNYPGREVYFDNVEVSAAGQ